MAPPGYGYGQPSAQNNALGLLAMIFGIISIPLGPCCTFIGVPLGIAAIVLGVMGRQKAAQGLASNDGQAKAGLITGVVGVCLGVLWVVASLALNFATIPLSN